MHRTTQGLDDLPPLQFVFPRLLQKYEKATGRMPETAAGDLDDVVAAMRNDLARLEPNSRVVKETANPDR